MSESDQWSIVCQEILDDKSPNVALQFCCCAGLINETQSANLTDLGSQ